MQARADKSKKGEGSSGTVTHAGNADVEEGVLEVPVSLPAEKEINAKGTVDKSVGSDPKQQTSRGTAHKEASGQEPVMHREDGAKKKTGGLGNNG